MKNNMLWNGIRGKLLRKSCLLLIMLCCFGVDLNAQHAYRCELGLQGGLAYYVGDAHPHVFQNVSPAYGAQFRYKFTPRWALKTKVQYTDLTYKWEDAEHSSRLGQLDVVGEYNFFRLSLSGIERSARAYTPYVFLGMGLALHGDLEHFGPYLPFGVGFKWQMSSRWSLQLDWQHELFFCDNIEGLEALDNTMGLNGSNFLRNDLVSTLTLGVGFHFMRVKSVCHTCNW